MSFSVFLRSNSTNNTNIGLDGSICYFVHKEKKHFTKWSKIYYCLS